MQTMLRTVVSIIANLLLLIFGTLLASGCSAATANHNLLDMFAIPEKAYDTKKLNVSGKDNQQLFFRIVKPYPSTELLIQYGQPLERAGWTKCVGKMEAWDFHEDRSSNDQFLVHQIANYWINEKEKKLAVILIRYYSKQLKEDQKPDNDIQSVAVLVQRGLDLRQEIAALSLSCSKTL